MKPIQSIAELKRKLEDGKNRLAGIESRIAVLETEANQLGRELADYELAIEYLGDIP